MSKQDSTERAVILPDICDYCMLDIPFNSSNIVLVRFRIGSFRNHKVMIHKSCILDQVREIIAKEL